MTDPSGSHNNHPEAAATDVEQRASLLVDSFLADSQFPPDSDRMGTRADPEAVDLANLMLSAREGLRQIDPPSADRSDDMVLRAMAAFDEESSDQNGETTGETTAAVTPLRQKRQAPKWLAAAAVTLLVGVGVGWFAVNSTQNERFDSTAMQATTPDAATSESGSNGTAPEQFGPDLSAPAAGQDRQNGDNPAETGESPQVGDVPDQFDQIQAAIQLLGERLRSILGLYVP